jgi:hypothetical protein
MIKRSEGSLSFQIQAIPEMIYLTAFKCTIASSADFLAKST